MKDSSSSSKTRLVSLARRAAQTSPGRRIAAAIREEKQPTTGNGSAPRELNVDGWLTSLYGDRLDEIEAACAGAGREGYANFRDLDDDLWALLLSRQYSSYPNILALLPELPEPGLQINWNGASGLTLLGQSKAFYRHAKTMVEAHSETPLSDSRVLDFGLGWGRLTRFFARDVEPGNLVGVDPTEEILEICRSSRVPADLARTEFLPESLPFDKIDLAYSFSVFTHISETAAQTCLSALHEALNPGGLLILTIRPPGYLVLDPKMHDALAELGDPVEAMNVPRYVFVPHPIEGGHPQYDGGEMTYGEAVISLPYVREKWGGMFDLLDVKVSTEDIYQVAITLRKRPTG
jgi:SAM-dependent methyltransferase